MDTDMALASLASGRAVLIGAECDCGVHDAPPGCAWKHCHEKYVWTPVCFTTSPHHGLVWSYRLVRSRVLTASTYTLLTLALRPNQRASRIRRSGSVVTHL